MQIDREQKVQLENALTIALDESEFELYYQPIIDLKNNSIVSAEVLIRWSHQEKLIPTDLFIPLAEESDLILEIDRWVLKNACEKAAIWFNQLGHKVSIHVNLSSKFFQRLETPQVIEEVLNSTGLSGSLLCLEITETAVISDAEVTKKNILEIKKLGVLIALDDFGTGFSSLNYLTQFSLDKIKIDRTFISNLHKDKSNQAVVDALIKLANQLDIVVVAEGVEKIEHHNYLINAGCHFSQGFFYSKPIMLEEFINLYSNSKYVQVLNF